MTLDYLYTTVQSNLLEIPIYYFIYRRRGLSFARVALITTLANGVSHPWVFFGFMGVGISYFSSVLMAESFAVLSEGAMHGWSARLPLRTTLRASLLANLFSWQVAPAISYALFF
ncbi:MAG: hypothetical protein AB7F86_20545 [Bdellovibrionales bacterium]